jgi:coatomer subunit beta'
MYQEMEAAQEILSTIPEDQLNRTARFLEGQGHKDLALEIATDPEHRFDLSLALNHLDIALEIAKEADVEHRWKTLGDAALTAWDIALAAECFQHARDLGSLLLIYSSTSDADGLAKLADQATEANAHNVAFTCRWLLGDIDACTKILGNTDRFAEAALFAQTYKPSQAIEAVGKWKESLVKAKKGRVAQLIGVPGEDEELFPEWEEWLRLEKEGVSVDTVNGKVEEDAEQTEGATQEVADGEAPEEEEVE